MSAFDPKRTLERRNPFGSLERQCGFNSKTVLLRVFDLDQIQDRRARFIVIARWSAAAFFDPVVFKH
jgi:hypothetical protein